MNEIDNPRTDSEMVAILEAVFRCPRPRDFTVGDGDQSCMEFDKLFHEHTPDTLPLEPFFNLGYSPLTELLPAGMKYYFPALAKWSLASNDDGVSWSGETLMPALRAASLWKSFSVLQRKAVAAYLEYLKKTRSHLLESFSLSGEVNDLIRQWAKVDTDEQR